MEQQLDGLEGDKIDIQDNKRAVDEGAVVQVVAVYILVVERIW